MTRIVPVSVLLGVLVLPATAQNAPRDFPMGRQFKAISISGFEVQKIGMTLTVARDPKSDRLMGSGHAGCNSWIGTVIIREDQIDVIDVVTTKKFCGKPRMTSEEAFLASVKSAHRWRVDDKNRLILEGDTARLLLAGGGPDKQPEKKSDKKPAGKPNQQPQARR